MISADAAAKILGVSARKVYELAAPAGPSGSLPNRPHIPLQPHQSGPEPVSLCRHVDISVDALADHEPQHGGVVGGSIQAGSGAGILGGATTTTGCGELLAQPVTLSASTSSSIGILRLAGAGF